MGNVRVSIKSRYGNCVIQFNNLWKGNKLKGVCVTVKGLIVQGNRGRCVTFLRNFIKAKNGI